MIYVAMIFLVSTFVLGIMSIGAAASGSFDDMANIFYISAGMFLLFLTVDTLLRTRREKKGREEYVKNLEKATRGTQS